MFKCFLTSGPQDKTRGLASARLFFYAAAIVIAAAAQMASAQDKSRDDDDGNPAQFAYVANFGPQPTISGFAIDESTGALTPVSGSPFNNVDAPISVAVDPTGRFVYATQGAAISGYRIDAATGTLTRVRRRPFSSPDPRGIVVDPTARFVYVANFESGNVTAYKINTDTGELSRIPGSPFAADSGTYSVAADPTGRFLYASNVVAGDITEYTIDATTGALTPIGSPVTTGQNGFSITAEPLGRFLFETNQNGTVLAFRINPTTGALAPAVGSPFAAGIGPFSVAADPTGRFVYVVNAGTGDPGTATVSAYRITPFPQAPGELTPVSGSPFAAGSQADYVTVDPTGRFVYVANYGDSNVGVYLIAGDGSLTPIAGSPFPAGSGPNWIAISAGRRRTHPVYSATVVPPPDFSGSPVKSFSPVAINFKGEVTGSVVFTSGFETFASGFLYSGGTSIIVGNTRSSEAFGINDKTQVVGAMFISPPHSGEPPQHAFLYSNGTTTVLDSVIGRQSFAYGINNAGTITGSLSTGLCGGFPPCPNGDTHAFVYKGVGLTDLGTLGGNFSEGKGINNHGEIVGGSNVTASGPLHLFLFEHGAMHDLGTLKGNSTEGSAINDRGQIIGSATQIGFLFSDGDFHRLPTFKGGTYSLPGGINNGGSVVGTSDVFGGGPTRAFLYTEGELIDLNNIVEPSLPLLTTAAGINDKGQIVVSGLNGRSYVLTPQQH